MREAKLFLNSVMKSNFRIWHCYVTSSPW